MNCDLNGGKSLRACMVSFYYAPEYSGSAIQAGNLCRYLNRMGVETIVVTAMLSSRLPREEMDGIKVFRLKVLKSKDFQIPSFWLALCWFLFRKRKDFDVIHAHGTLQHGPVGIIGRLLGKPTFLKVAMANSDIAFHRHGRIWGRVNKFFFLRFDRYIATSEQIRQEYLSKGLPPEVIVRIPNGVDTDRFRPCGSSQEKEDLKKGFGFPAGPLIMFCGVIIPRKNVELIVRVFCHIHSEHPTAHLALVGPWPVEDETNPGGYMGNLRRLLREAGLQDHVTFTGYRECVDLYLRAADVFFFPSKQEGMPNVLLEAMSCGLPCIVSRISGTEDLIDDGVNGMSLDPESVEEFAGALSAILGNPGLRHQLGNNARTSIMEQFALSRTARRITSLYLLSLSGKRPTERT